MLTPHLKNLKDTLHSNSINPGALSSDDHELLNELNLIEGAHNLNISKSIQPIKSKKGGFLSISPTPGACPCCGRSY